MAWTCTPSPPPVIRSLRHQSAPRCWWHRCTCSLTCGISTSPHLVAQFQPDAVVLDEVQFVKQRDERGQSKRREQAAKLLALAAEP